VHPYGMFPVWHEKRASERTSIFERACGFAGGSFVRLVLRGMGCCMLDLLAPKIGREGPVIRDS
jgi:hypothetical protein